MGLTRACGWLALSALVLISAEAQTTATTQESAASASFTYVSDDGCVQNEVTVFANRTTVVSAKAPSATAEVTYFRYRYDYCEDSDLGTDLGTSRQLVFSGDLNSASLSATIDGHSTSGSVVPVSFALVWEGKGDITHQSSRPQRTRASGTKLIGGDSLSRTAVVTGTVDRRDISQAVVDASLHTTRKTISR
jgi:hypothetical protein